MSKERIFQLTETQILKIIDLSRGGSYFIDYTGDRPYAGKEYDLEPEEIIDELIKNNI